DVTLFMKHPRYGTGFGHVAAVFAEHVANLTYGAIAIVGVDVEKNGDAAGPIAFERKFFVGRSGKFAGAALDGPFDVIGRHILSLGSDNCTAKARVGIGIAAAVLGG